MSVTRASKYVLAQRASGRYCKNPTAANKAAMNNSITRYSNDAIAKGKTLTELKAIVSKLSSCSAVSGVGKVKRKKRVGTTAAATTAAVGKTRKRKTAKR
jgi:hypothetical protein